VSIAALASMADAVASIVTVLIKMIITVIISIAEIGGHEGQGAIEMASRHE